MRRQATNEIEFVGEIVRETVFNALYYEWQLRNAHAKKAIMKAMLLRGNFYSDAMARITADDFNEDSLEKPNDSLEFVRQLWAEALYDIESREESLRNANRQIALAKAIVMRLDLMGKISIKDIYVEMQKRLDDDEPANPVPQPDQPAQE